VSKANRSLRSGQTALPALRIEQRRHVLRARKTAELVVSPSRVSTRREAKPILTEGTLEKALLRAFG